MEHSRKKQVVIKKTFKRIAPEKIQGRSEWKYSNWFITISTNVRTVSDADFFNFQDRFHDALMELFTVETLDENVIIVNQKYAEEGEAWTPEWVDMDNVKVEAHIEEGTTKKGGRVHAHILLEVRHKAHFHVTIEGIKRFIDNHPALPEVKGSYVQVKLVNEAMKHVLSYIRKDDTEITPEEWHELDDSVKSLRI
jgi:hypothetical protein